MPAKPLSVEKAADAALGELYLANQPRVGTSGFDVFVPSAAVPALIARKNAIAMPATSRIPKPRTIGTGDSSSTRKPTPVASAAVPIVATAMPSSSPSSDSWRPSHWRNS